MTFTWAGEAQPMYDLHMGGEAQPIYEPINFWYSCTYFDGQKMHG